MCVCHVTGRVSDFRVLKKINDNICSVPVPFPYNIIFYANISFTQNFNAVLSSQTSIIWGIVLFLRYYNIRDEKTPLHTQSQKGDIHSLVNSC